MFILCTMDEAIFYLDKAKKWLSTTHGLWNDSFGAKSAVAEYIANQDGKTIYEIRSEVI